MELLENCTLCPRQCGVNRIDGQRGFCGAGILPRAGRAALHHWEEPCISGTRGSGTVFFSHCTLGCVYCQNNELSAQGTGLELSIKALADTFLSLQQQGAHNLNLVTPTHYAPQIISALDDARRRGFTLPVVYNCGGYERAETVRLLAPYVDIWLPDFKYFSPYYAKLYSNAADYFEWSKEAIEEMAACAGTPQFDQNGLMRSGVIIRHLCLPGLAQDTRQVLGQIARRWYGKVLVSLMRQYTPLPYAAAFPELMRPVSDKEYAEAVAYMEYLGLSGFLQHGESAAESFIPSFRGEGLLK